MRFKGCGKKQCEVCVSVCETDNFSSTVTGDMSITNLIVTISAKFIFLRASAVANNMLEKPLGSLGLSGTTVNVMIGNKLGMRIVYKNIYLDIFIVGNIQVSLKMSR